MNDYDCSQCTDATKAMRGCDGTASMDVYILGDKSINGCPKARFNVMPKEDRDFIDQLMLTYFFYNKGILPEKGGWKDQDLRVMNLLPIIGSFVEKEGQRKARVVAAKEKAKNDKGMT